MIMMKQIYLLALGALVFASCKKSNDEPTDPTVVTPAPTGPHVSQANFTAGMAVGSTIRFNGIMSSGGGVLTIPQAGANQTWNFATAPVAYVDSLRIRAGNTNTAFSGAAFSTIDTIFYGTEEVPRTTFYEISASGWRAIGYSMPAFLVSYPGVGSLTYPAQNDMYTPTRLPVTTPFPLQVGDSTTFNTTVTENSIANAPGAPIPIVNTPSSQRFTHSGSVKVIASGNMTLPGWTTALPVLVSRRIENVTINFFLNGVTPPAALLQGLGVVDGQTTTVTHYDIFHQGNLGYLGNITVESGSIVAASLRKQ
jgi:hypothetical protein